MATQRIFLYFNFQMVIFVWHHFATWSVPERSRTLIVNQYDPNLVPAKDWKALADQCYLNSKILTRLVNEMVDRLLRVISSSIHRFEILYRSFPVLQWIEVVAKKQYRRGIVSLESVNLHSRFYLFPLR